MGKIKKVLIANRGEIALRVIRACRELGIATVAVHSEADAAALHVRLSDQAICIGPPIARKSYLNIPSIIAAAEVSGADAIHPGYGFLSENAEFADICRQCGLRFIGPTADDMRAWGDKVSARALARRLGLPLLPGTGILESSAHAVAEASRIGFPVILKAAGGGGGRGMKIIRSAAELERALPQAQSEALAAFGRADIYLERYLEAPRHVEFQVLADGEGGALVLGERECSIQRRHQKIIEEAPCNALSRELREDMSRTIERVLSETRYRSAGTLEFLFDSRGELYFMEMNTRIQVEHPVTEMVMGVDLVVEQIRIAEGQRVEPLERRREARGHAIECRINAEDPRTFAPWPGLITEYHPPGGTGIRVDSGVYGGWRVPSHYDSLLAKVIAHGSSRSEAIARMKRALDETIIAGIRTNVVLHRKIMEHPDFVSGAFSTQFLDKFDWSSIPDAQS